MLTLLCACEGLQVRKANEAVNKKAVSCTSANYLHNHYVYARSHDSKWLVQRVVHQRAASISYTVLCETGVEASFTHSRSSGLP